MDSQTELAWRMNALYGLKNAMGKRIVAVGSASGWGVGGRKAAERARDIWKLDIQTVGYPALGEMVKAARRNDALVRKAQADS